MRNIKRFLSPILCILLIISALPLVAGASGETIEWLAGYQETDGHDVFFYCTTVTGNSATIYEVGNKEGNSIVLMNNNHYINYDVTPSFSGTYTLEVEASSHESSPEVLRAYADDEEIGALNIADGAYVNYTEGYRTIGTVEMLQGETTKISFSNKTADNSGDGSGATMVCIRGIRLTYAGDDTEEPKEDNILWKAGYRNSAGELAEGYADIPYTIELSSGGAGVIGNIGSDYSYQILFGEANHKICYEVTPKYTGIYSLKVQTGGNNTIKAFLDGVETGELAVSTGEWNTYGELTEIAQLELTQNTPAVIAFCMANPGLMGFQDISLTYIEEVTPDEPGEPDNPPAIPDEPESIEWMAGYEETDGHDIFYYITLVNGNAGVPTELGNRHGDSMVLDSNNHRLNYDVSAAEDGVYTLEVEASTNEASPEVLHAFANDEEIGTLEIADGTYISYSEGYRAIGTVNMKAGEIVKIGFSNKTAEDSTIGSALICIRGIKLTYKEELPPVNPDEPTEPDEPDNPDNPPAEPESIEWMAGYMEADGHDIFYHITLASGGTGTDGQLGSRHGDSMVLDSNNHYLNYDVTAAKDGVYTLEVEASTNEASPEVLYAFANDEEIGTLEIADGGYVSYTGGFRAIGTVSMKAGRSVKIGFSNRTSEDATVGKGLICIRGIKLTYKAGLETLITPPQLNVENVSVYQGQMGEIKLALPGKVSNLKEYTVKVICPTADVASTLTFDAPAGFETVTNVSGSTVEFKVTGISTGLYDFGTINCPTYANTTLKVSAEVVYDIEGAEIRADVSEVTVDITAKVNNNTGGSGSTSGVSMGGGGGFKPSQTVPGTTPQAPTEVTNGFTDLGSVSWAEESIMNLYNKGIISKAADSKFRPGDSVTRAEFVKMLVTALGITSNSKSLNLHDVSSADWYYTYVSAAVENGLVLGDDMGNFRPGDSITRQDICVIVSRAMDKLGYVPTQGYGELFADDAAISDYAKSAVYRMRTHEIVSGVGQGMFDPLSDATRAATAKIIDTFMKEANI